MAGELGIRTALDLQLLAGSSEAEQLLSALQQSGLSVGDRAKGLSGGMSALGIVSEAPERGTADADMQRLR